MSINDRIREARKMRGLTQEQLGDLINVAKTTIAGYEKNREPSAAKIGELADVLHIDVSFLLQDEVKTFHDNRATVDEMERLIKKYRALDQYGKNTVDAVLNCENERCIQSGVAIPISELSGSSDNSSKEDSKTSKLAIVAMGGNGVEIKEIPADADERVLKILQEMDERKNQP